MGRFSLILPTNKLFYPVHYIEDMHGDLYHTAWWKFIPTEYQVSGEDINFGCTVPPLHSWFVICIIIILLYVWFCWFIFVPSWSLPLCGSPPPPNVDLEWNSEINPAYRRHWTWCWEVSSQDRYRQSRKSKTFPRQAGVHTGKYTMQVYKNKI